MDARVIVLVLLWWSGDAAAHKVHKCVDGETTVYQSDPCASGKAEKTWEAVPDAFDPDRQARLDALQRQLDARRLTGTRTGPAQRVVRGASISQYRDPDRCKDARAQRAVAFNAAGSRRSFELTRRMDDLVYDACQ